MNLSEVFTQLVYGELAQTSIAVNGPDNITDADQMKLANHVNLGLTALYKRFALKEGKLTLALTTDRLEYPLDRRFALNDPDTTETELFILDTVAEPFNNDVLKVERVVMVPTDTDLEDFELALNDLSDKYSVFTPRPAHLRIPVEIVNQESDLPDQLLGSTLDVYYRANHPKIDLSEGWVDAELTELELPDSHLEALLLFVAARTNTPLGLGQYEGVAGNSYMQKYELECQRLEQQNLVFAERTTNTKLRDNGWV